MISKDALEKFKTIWKKETGEEISDQNAIAEAISLLTLFSHVYRPVKKEWLEEIDERKDDGYEIVRLQNKADEIQ